MIDAIAGLAGEALLPEGEEALEALAALQQRGLGIGLGGQHPHEALGASAAAAAAAAAMALQIGFGVHGGPSGSLAGIAPAHPDCEAVVPAEAAGAAEEHAGGLEAADVGLREGAAVGGDTEPVGAAAAEAT